MEEILKGLGGALHPFLRPHPGGGNVIADGDELEVHLARRSAHIIAFDALGVDAIRQAEQVGVDRPERPPCVGVPHAWVDGSRGQRGSPFCKVLHASVRVVYRDEMEPVVFDKVVHAPRISRGHALLEFSEWHVHGSVDGFNR